MLHLIGALEGLLPALPEQAAAAVRMLRACLSLARLAAERPSYPLPSAAVSPAAAPPQAGHLFPPSLEAAAALLPQLLAAGGAVAWAGLCADVQRLLTSERRGDRAAGLTALLVSLEQRKKLHPPRAVPDACMALLQLLHAWPAASGTRPGQVKTAGLGTDSSALVTLRDGCDEMLLVLRCIDSIAAQSAAFRNLGPAGVGLLPALATTATDLADATGRCDSRSGSAGRALMQALVLVFLQLCATVSGILRQRADIVEACWAPLAPCCSGGLRFLRALDTMASAVGESECAFESHKASTYEKSTAPMVFARDTPR